jgi:hypothetical protein
VFCSTPSRYAREKGHLHYDWFRSWPKRCVTRSWFDRNVSSSASFDRRWYVRWRWVCYIDLQFFDYMPQESHLHSTTTTNDRNRRKGREVEGSVGGTENGMFVPEGGSRLYKSSNKSFLFCGSIPHNNPRRTQQPVFGRNSTLGKFGVWGVSRNGGMVSHLLFYFVDTSGVPKGLMPRCQVTLDFRPRKHNNPISNS